MKKSILACATMSAFAGVANAQSSVTLYGIVDNGLSYTSNAGGSHQYNMSSGVLSGSRFGLLGSEDLGGGLKAIFTLENGFDVNSGKASQGGLLFGRRAFVGLSSNRFGTVTFGRQYDSQADYLGPLEVGDQWGGYIAAHPGDLDGFNNLNRLNNVVKYTSATYAGLSFGGLYSLGGTPGNFSRNAIWSLGAGYTNGPLTLASAYEHINNPNASFFGSGGTVAATVGGVPGNNTSSPVYSGYASAHSEQIISVGGAYAFGAATVGATYANTQFRDLGDTTSGPNPLHYSGTANFNNAEVNFKYQLTPAFLMGVAYDYTKGSSVNGNGGAKYSQASLGCNYSLSKRTILYMIGIYQHATGTDSRDKPAVAAINLLTPSTTASQTTIHVGIRHRF
ncbi:porin [Paraburkholderia sp. RL17-347-BIC-D]|uniref:porin n=1 Tax=Paraburkholderia sp. RL17-347-BIC-D TaxID=3031632 RepID=UPI0038BBA242